MLGRSGKNLKDLEIGLRAACTVATFGHASRSDCDVTRMLANSRHQKLLDLFAGCPSHFLITHTERSYKT